MVSGPDHIGAVFVAAGMRLATGYRVSLVVIPRERCLSSASGGARVRAVYHPGVGTGHGAMQVDPDTHDPCGVAPAG